MPCRLNTATAKGFNTLAPQGRRNARFSRCMKDLVENVRRQSEGYFQLSCYLPAAGLAFSNSIVSLPQITRGVRREYWTRKTWTSSGSLSTRMTRSCHSRIHPKLCKQQFTINNLGGVSRHDGGDGGRKGVMHGIRKEDNTRSTETCFENSHKLWSKLYKNRP